VTIIALDNLAFTYRGAATPALRGVSLDVDDGEFVVLAGASGCGKSTLALGVGGFLHHGERGRVSGAVRVAGVDVGSEPLYHVADRVGLVQQNAEDQFCTLRVEDEVAFGLENRRLPPPEIEERLTAALALCGVPHLRTRALATLSGGEQQRVAIAAMLASRPQVLVFDEPTSNLDPTATAGIFGVLDRLRQETGLTILVAEHKLGYLRPFRPRLVRMAQGMIVEHRASIPSPGALARPRPNAGGEVLVETRALTFCHGERAILRDLDLDLRAGQLVALMGDNGSGKTTLLRCLMGLLRPASGSVRLAGQMVGVTPVSDLARQAGFLFQNPDHQLLAATVQEEALLLGRNLGAVDEVASRAEADLRAAGLWESRSEHPFCLSYGQKRRLNLVAATAHQPVVILADEPLIGQDPGNASALLERLRQAARGGACVLASLHDPASVWEYADRVLFLEDGRLLVDGPPDEAFEQLSLLGRTAYAASR